MRILVLSRGKGKQHHGRLIWQELRRQGVEAGICYLEQSRAQREQCVLQYAPDFVFVTGGGSLTRYFLEWTAKCAKLVLWMADAYPPGFGDDGYWERVKGVYSAILVSVKGMVPILSGYAPVVKWLPQYFDPNYYRVIGTRLDPLHRSWDCCFLGTCRGEDHKRVRWLKELKKSFSRIRIGGYIPGIANEAIFSDRMVQTYRQSKLTFDISNRDGYEDQSFRVSSRLFHALGSGCFYLTYPVKDLDILFNPGEHLDVYNGTLRHLKAKIRYYLNHDEEREWIALQGQREIFKAHLISHRVRQYRRLMETL